MRKAPFLCELRCATTPPPTPEFWRPRCSLHVAGGTVRCAARHKLSIGPSVLFCSLPVCDPVTCGLMYHVQVRRRLVLSVGRQQQWQRGDIAGVPLLHMPTRWPVHGWQCDSYSTPLGCRGPRRTGHLCAVSPRVRTAHAVHLHGPLCMDDAGRESLRG